MPVPMLYEALAMPEPPPSWMWSIMLFGPNGLIIPPARIINGNAPFYQLGVDSIMVGGQPMPLPAGVSLEPLHITFYESFTWVMTRQIESWTKKIRNSRGEYGVPSDYMGSALFMFQDSMGIPQFIYQVDGLWPTGMQSLDLNYEGSTGFTASVQFEIYRKYGEITLFGTLEDLGSDLLGDVGIDTSSLSGITGLAETGITGIF